jgi:hypothetical protein
MYPARQQKRNIVRVTQGVLTFLGGRTGNIPSPRMVYWEASGLSVFPKPIFLLA